MHAQQLIGTWLGVALGSLTLGGCFVGTAANGLACRTDDDCGIGVACEEDPGTALLCCGGSCSAVAGSSSSTGNPTTTTSTSSSSSTSAESSSSDASSSTSGDACGNGVVEPELGEECEAIDGPCSDDCLLCGNGGLDDGELCDPGMTETPGVSCSEDCLQLTLFSWDSEDPAPKAEEAFEFPSFDLLTGESLQWERSTADVAPVASGLYFDPSAADPELVLDDGWPESRLLSRTLAFPELQEGDEVMIAIDHAYALNFDEERFWDHGRVDLVRNQDEGPDTWIRLLPEPGAGGTVLCEDDFPAPVSSCFPMNELPSQPFCDLGVDEWIVGSGSQNVVLPVPWETVSAQTLQVSFRLRYDCANPDVRAPEDDAWRLFALSVVVSRPDPER